MSYYRDLNKELIEQVQTMRINMKLYCDEIIQLKSELRDKHETSVILRKECYNWAVENFIRLIQTVQPDSDILPVLQNYLPPKERQSSTITTTSAQLTTRTPRISQISSGSEERSSGSARRRSSQLTAEFQRSNSILNSRRSVCSTSPIRRSSSDSREDQDEEEEVEEEEQYEEDVENEVERTTTTTVAEYEAPEPENSENVNENEDREAMLNIIYEDSEDMEEDDDEDEPNNDNENNEESMYESVEEITVADDTISTTSQRSTLKDITNIVLASSTQKSSLNNNSSHKTIRKRGKPRKNKSTNSFDQENTTDSEMELTVTDADEGRGAILHHNSSVDHSETLQEPRHCNLRHLSLRNKSIPIGHSFNKSCEEINLLASTSMTEYTDMTLGNFKDAACSTPNSRHNSLRKPSAQQQPPPTANTINLPTDSESGSTTDNSTTRRRPSRQCKPKDLAEPKIGSKLRNETEVKSLANRKPTKNQTKKKSTGKK